MEGYDEDFVAVCVDTAWLSAFAGSLRSSWPSMLISVEGFGVPAEKAQWVADLSVLAGFDPGLGHVWFARDRAMVDHFNEYSYMPMGDGQGVVAVLYSRPDDMVTPLEVPESVQETGIVRDGYTATLFLPSSAISGSLITPACVSDGGFSAEVWQLLSEMLTRDPIEDPRSWGEVD